LIYYIYAYEMLTFSDSTITVHAEAIRCILVLISPQMFEESVSEDILFLRYLMGMKSKANDFIKSLMTNIIENRKQLPRETKEEQAESIVLTLACLFPFYFCILKQDLF
jgi:hypothetical protein